MKILSSFDTNLKKEYIKDFTRQYSQEKIVVITRSVLYFLKKVMSNILRGILIYIVLIGSSYFLIGMDKTVQYGIWIALPFALVFFIIALENYIDYSMNFAIFTPDEALLVEQLGLFKRSTKSLDIMKIKSISITKSNRIYSLFDDGLLTIFNEGSNTNTHGMGEIVFKYVQSPEKVKDKIENIILYSKHRMDTL